MMRTLALSLVFFVLSVAVAEEAKRPSGEEQLAQMTWLAGNWQGKMWGGTFSAYYAKPSDGKLLSYSQLRADGTVRFYEFEVFSAEGGKVTVIPHPGGKRAKKFTLTEMGKAKAVFENPRNDFPTRIVYERVAPDRLVITLTDPHNESDKKEVFDLKAIAKK